MSDTGVGRSVRGMRVEFPPTPASVPAARRVAMLVLDALDCTHLRDDVALALTELTTNAVLHAQSVFSVAMLPTSTGVRIEVADANTHTPAQGPATGLANTGRGLGLLTALGRWGCVPTAHGKTMWCEIDRGS